MKEHHYTNVVETNIRERYFIIVDEGAELCPDKSMSRERQNYWELVSKCFLI